MQELTIDRMEEIEGGRGFWCGAAVGFTAAAFFFGGPVAGGLVINKAIGICLIDYLR